MSLDAAGAYINSCTELPSRRIELDNTKQVVTISQGSTSSGISGRTGVAVWNSCLLLTRFITSSTPVSNTLFKSKDVLELGCGTGLASIGASTVASKVIATDGNPEVCLLTKANMQKNSPGVAVQELLWGSVEVPPDLYSSMDTIYGSDLTYNTGSWRVLGETMNSILKNDGKVVYLATGHQGLAVDGELDGFVTVVSSMGLKVNSKLTGEANFELDKLLSAQEKEILAANGGRARIVVLDNQV